MARTRKLGYGEGSVYFEKETGRYRGEIRIDGRPKRVSGQTAREALANLDELRKAAADGVPPGDEWRLGAWLEWYSKTVAAKKDPNTAANYSWAFAKLKPLHGKRLRELTPHDVERLLVRLATETPITSSKKCRGGDQKALGLSSLRRIKATLGTALQKAEARGLVSRNVARIAEMPVVVGLTKEKRALTQDEAKSLLNADVGSRNEALLLVTIMLGLRPGEVLGLPWSAVDLDGKTLEVMQSLHRQLPNPQTSFLDRRSATRSQRKAEGSGAEGPGVGRPRTNLPEHDRRTNGLFQSPKNDP
jgi:integrase